MSYPQADPGDETLFDAASTVTPRCYACGNTKKNLCVFDANVAHGLINPSDTRPKTCLNRHDPSEGQIPY
jgi:hypothetical protein